MMMRRPAILAFVLFASIPAHAQSTSARDVISFLMTTRRVPTDDFARDQQAAEAARDTLSRALLIEIATLPLGTASGAFTYRFNPDIGTVERVTQSFGPLYVNRVITGGRGQATISVAFRHSDFIRLSGRDLRNGSLVTTANKFRDESAPFDMEALSLTLRMQTTTVFANYGITDSVDISVAVPMVDIALSGERVNTYRGTSLLQATGSATSIGPGDIAQRTKFQLWRGETAAIGGEVELRLPTGSVEELRGSGRLSVRPTLLISAGSDRVEGHVNVGFVAGGLSREALIVTALSAAVSDRLTISAEGLLRHISALHAMHEVAQPHPVFAGVDTLRLLPAAAGTTTATSALGMRWNLAGPWILNAYLLTPLLDRGLLSRPSPAVSLEYSIVR